MKNKRMRYISITAAILLVFVLLMLLFSNRSGDFSAMEAQDGVLDATSADFSSAVYEIDGEWTFYPEVLGSGAELDAAQPGERDESIPYGSYRLKIHAQPKQYLTLGGYSFDYSTRVLVNGSEVLEIGKVGASAAESEPRIDYMLIPIYTGEDGEVEVVCQYANFVHREGGGLTQMHLSTAENIDRMRRSWNLYSLVLGGSLCLFGMYFLLFAVFQGEIKYVFLAVICALLGLRDQNFYVLHLLPANYNWAVAYRFLVLMITLQPCFLLLLLQSLYVRLAKPIVVRCYAVLYAVFARYLPGALLALVGIGITTGMVKSGCRITTVRDLAVGMAGYILSGFLIGSAYRLFRELMPGRGILLFLLSGSAAYAGTLLLLKIRKEMLLAHARQVTVQLVQNGKWKKVKGLYDTGNTLRDATTKKPVSVVPYTVILELFPDEMRTGIAALARHETVPEPEQLLALQPRYIPFRGLEGRGFLPVIRISEMILVTEHTARHISGPLIALGGENSSSPRGYEIILHPDLMEGQEE